jgi:hypothetical protein
MQAKSRPDSFIATLSYYLASANRVLFEDERIFRSGGLFKTIVHMAELGQSPYKLTFRRMLGEDSRPALQAIRQ